MMMHRNHPANQESGVSGEPIIRHARQAGCAHVQLNTNGIRLGQDRKYAGSLDQLMAEIETQTGGRIAKQHLVTPKDRAMICMSIGTPDSIGDLLQQGLSRIKVPSLIYGNIRDADHAAGRAGQFDCLVGLPAEMLYPRSEPGR
jgi:hypothetical protein